jgi:DNA-binding NarL/FixJ family response regulator
MDAAMSDETISCLVADDHPGVLEVVAGFLETAGLRVAGRARDGEEALAKIETLRPRIALLDLRMPKLGGIEVARKVAQSHAVTQVILYTGYGDRAELTEALDIGVRGFVLKEAPLDDLLRAVHTVAAGDIYIDPVLGGTIASAAASSTLPTLTARERQVLRLLAEGLANKAIGEQLFISADTVRTHIRKAMDKLGSDTRTQAVATAIRQSLIA